MKKPTFELQGANGNSEFRLLIITNHSFDEEELDDHITSIFHRVNSSLDEVTGNLLSGCNLTQCFETGPKWILTEPDADGIRHRMGISVHPRLLDKLITEMSFIGYRIIHEVSENPLFNKALNSHCA